MNSKIVNRTVLIALALTLASGGAGAVAAMHTSGAPPLIDPANFGPAGSVTNPFLPLKPGSSFRFRGVKDGRHARELVRVTTRTKAILGVPNTVVNDRVFVSGRLHETTQGWYAQDRQGNVWYFGEKTKTRDARGHVKGVDGFEAGVKGAQAGIVMPATPQVGQEGQPGFYKGHIEDHLRVISLNASVKTPAVSSGNALQMQETTPLEPGVVGNKFYVSGIGLVSDVQGRAEHLRLISFNTR